MSQDRAADWDVERTEESYDEEQSPAIEFEILNYPADTTLKGYKTQSEDGLLVVPKFQRRFVWDQVKASKLIESFLIGLPVPGVFLYKPRQGVGFQVIDGHQRITSIVAFQKGVIGDKKFVLKGVNKRWEGKSFDDLSESERFKLEQSVMRATIIQQLDPHDDRSIYLIFERLNTGGVNLNPMEVRRCVYHGELLDTLDHLNKDSNWRKCIGNSRIDKRYRDTELILRVVALYERQTKYEKPMKGFLSGFMADNRTLSLNSDAARRFPVACASVISALGDRPFHLRGKLNYGALDSTLVALMRTGATPPAEAFRSLFSDPEFLAATSANTSDRQEIEIRLGKALNALK